MNTIEHIIWYLIVYECFSSCVLCKMLTFDKKCVII